MPTVRVIAYLLLPVCLISGCGDSAPLRYAVSGSVTFDGEPVETGMILFKDSSGQVAADGGNIAKGQYLVQVLPGNKRVEILAHRPEPGQGPMPSKDNPMAAVPHVEQFAPQMYNTHSVLTAEIKAGGENRFDYDLKSAPAGK